ncbi:MAG TPA: diguanylate cyclase [Acidimicrobiales bacterium]|nr:diguanylate cyclase [Acidimicrobiales bacterium]
MTSAERIPPSPADGGTDAIRRYHGLLAVLEQPVLVVNADALVVESNTAADSLLAASGSAVVGRTDPLAQAVDEDYRPVGRERSPAMRVLGTGVPSAGQIVGIQPASGGPVRWFSVNAEPLRSGAAADDLVVLALTDVTERKALELELTHLALHDGLTGLANRTLLVDRIGHAMARSQRRRPDPGVGVAMLFVDIDDFASVNDTLGNRVGDEILRILAQRLRSAVREEDTVSRIGGDEFVVLCDEINRADLARFCVRVTQVFGQPVICRVGEEWRSVAIGCTAGVATARAGEDADRFLQRVDNMVKEQSAAATAERSGTAGIRPSPSPGLRRPDAH